MHHKLVCHGGHKRVLRVHELVDILHRVKDGNLLGRDLFVWVKGFLIVIGPKAATAHIYSFSRQFVLEQTPYWDTRDHGTSVSPANFRELKGFLGNRAGVSRGLARRPD